MVGALSAVAAKGEVSWVPVAIIAAREVWMSVYRVTVGRRGDLDPGPRPPPSSRRSSRASPSCCAWRRRWRRTAACLSVAVWVAVAFTVVTGGQYFLDGRRASQAAYR